MPRPRPLPRWLRARPFTVAEARAAGVSVQRLRAPDLRAPHRGVRVPVTVPDTLATRARAALLILPPGTVVTGLQAARLCELPTPLDWSENGPVTFRVPLGGGRPRIAGIDVEVAAKPWETHAARWPGEGPIPVLHPRHVWAALAEALPFTDAVALADAVRRSWADGESMRRVVEVLGGGRRGERALAVLAAVRYPVDSAMESRLRLLLIDAGLPEPVCGRNIADAAGGWVARPDLSWPTRRVAVEYDGGHHRTDARQWAADIQRRQNLEALGWRVVVVTAQALLRHPDHVVATVRAALAAQGARW